MKAGDTGLINLTVWNPIFAILVSYISVDTIYKLQWF